MGSNVDELLAAGRAVDGKATVADLTALAAEEVVQRRRAFALHTQSRVILAEAEAAEQRALDCRRVHENVTLQLAEQVDRLPFPPGALGGLQQRSSIRRV